MKALFHKILSVTMAFVVLFTTTSFAVDMHYCGEVLVDIAVFKDAKDCGMLMATERPTESPEAKRMSCCKDKHIVIEGQDELRNAQKQFQLEPAAFIAVFFLSREIVFTGLDDKRSFSDGYPPPDITTDRIILHEQFLI